MAKKVTHEKEQEGEKLLDVAVQAMGIARNNGYMCIVCGRSQPTPGYCVVCGENGGL